MKQGCAWCVIAVVAACGGKRDDGAAAGSGETAAKPTVVDAAPAVDPACVAKVKELEPWLATLKLEEASHEVDAFTHPATVELPASPVEYRLDTAALGPTGVQVWNTDEPDRAEKKLPPSASPKQVAERLATTFAAPAGDVFDAAPDDRIRIDVDAASPWGDLVRFVDAAAAAGYREALFVVKVPSVLTAPPGLPDRTDSIEDFDRADDRLDALRDGDTCPRLGNAGLGWDPQRSAADNAAEYARRTAAALVECRCAVDPDELRALAWTTSRWGQASPRAGITIRIGADDAQPVALATATPWSDAIAALLALAPAGASPPSVKLVVE